MLKIADSRPNSFLLESVEGGDTRGRYSIIGLKPDVIWRTQGDKPEINRRAPHRHAELRNPAVRALSPRCAR